MSGEIREGSRAGKEYEASQPWRSRIIYHPIYYTDFSSLRAIIERTDNWSEIFAPIFGRKDLVVAALSGVEPGRNRIAHSRQCLPEDIASLDQAFSMLENAVGKAIVDELAARTTGLLDGDTSLRRYNESLLAAGGAVAQCVHISESELDPMPPKWLLEEAYGDQSETVLELDRLLREYVSIPRGQGSALRLRAWPGLEPTRRLLAQLPDLSPSEGGV